MKRRGGYELNKISPPKNCVPVFVPVDLSQPVFSCPEMSLDFSAETRQRRLYAGTVLTSRIDVRTIPSSAPYLGLALQNLASCRCRLLAFLSRVKLPPFINLFAILISCSRSFHFDTMGGALLRPSKSPRRGPTHSVK